MDQPAKEPEFLTRRRFLAALAASVVAAGCSLPIGMPTEVARPHIKVTWREMAPMKFKIVFETEAIKQQFLKDREISVDRTRLVRAAA